MFISKATSPILSIKKNTTVFNVTVRVHGCQHIPTPTACVFCKWKLLNPISCGFASPSKRKAKYALAGETHVQEVSNSHQVTWDHLVTLPECIMRLDPSTKMLKSCILRLSIRQVNRQSLSGYTRLGIVTIDLAEYAGSNEILKTFLLEDSHFNSTVNVNIKAEQISGDVLFRQKQSPPATMNTSNNTGAGINTMTSSNVTSGTLTTTSFFSGSNIASINNTTSIMILPLNDEEMLSFTKRNPSSLSNLSPTAQEPAKEVVNEFLRMSEDRSKSLRELSTSSQTT